MATRIQDVTVRGNLTGDPSVYAGREGKKDFTRFSVAVNENRFNEETKKWEQADVVFHDVVAYDGLARNVASLHKGDTVLVNGDLEFTKFVDREGVEHAGHQIVASDIGPSLRRYSDVQLGARQEQAASVSPDQVAQRTGQSVHPAAGPAQPGAGWATAQDQARMDAARRQQTAAAGYSTI